MSKKGHNFMNVKKIRLIKLAEARVSALGIVGNNDKLVWEKSGKKGIFPYHISRRGVSSNGRFIKKAKRKKKIKYNDTITSAFNGAGSKGLFMINESI